MSNANDYALRLAQIKVLKDILDAEDRAIREAAAANMMPGDKAGAKIGGTKVGSINYREASEAKPKVVNETAFLLWVEKNHPSEVVTTKTVRSSFRTVALTNATTTGELPDGVEMGEPGNPVIAVPALPKGAAEAIIADFRVNGLSGVLTLPAIKD